MTASGIRATWTRDEVRAGPKIDMLNLHSGSTSGGTQVMIAGCLLRNVASVHFGTKAVKPVQSPTDTVVIAVSPHNAPDTVMVYVTDCDGNDSNRVPFTYRS
jgi:hypothetical protein